MMAFDYLHLSISKKIQCTCCHKESTYWVQTYKIWYPIQLIHCSSHFLACAESDCNFCVVDNKRAQSYIKEHTSSKKWKHSNPGTDINPSFKDLSSKNHTLICPLCDFQFDHSTSPSHKKSIEIICNKCNEMLLSCNICAHKTTATSHGQKLRKASML